jgi:hypothetical protein
MLADKLNAVSDEGARDAMGIKILGEKYFELKQMIAMGGDEIKKAGGDQVTWGKQTQDALTRMQRAWANMWNELSVMTADFMRDFEPLLGLLRFIVNALMPLVRLALAGIGYVLDGIQLAVMSIAYYWAKFTGDSATVDRLGKSMENLNKKIDERNSKLKENLDKDLEGAQKGISMLIGDKTGEEGVDKPAAKKSKETRTDEDIQAY